MRPDSADLFRALLLSTVLAQEHFFSDFLSLRLTNKTQKVTMMMFTGVVSETSTSASAADLMNLQRHPLSEWPSISLQGCQGAGGECQLASVLQQFQRCPLERSCSRCCKNDCMAINLPAAMPRSNRRMPACERSPAIPTPTLSKGSCSQCWKKLASLLPQEKFCYG